MAESTKQSQQYTAPNIVTKKDSGTTFVDNKTGKAFNVTNPKVAEILASKKRYSKA